MLLMRANEFMKIREAGPCQLLLIPALRGSSAYGTQTISVFAITAFSFCSSWWLYPYRLCKRWGVCHNPNNFRLWASVFVSGAS